MLNDHDRERIRRAYYLEKKSIHQIARDEGCSRDTIRRAIVHDPSTPKAPRVKKSAPVFGPYQDL